MSRLMIWWMEIWRSTWCRRQASGGCRAVLPMWVENEIDRWSHWGNVLGSQICCFAVEHTALAQEACWTDYHLDPLLAWGLLLLRILLRCTIPPYIITGKWPVRKDLTAEINCIPPQLAPVIYGGIHRWYKGIIGSFISVA
jgi:hypothetical protein